MGVRAAMPRKTRMPPPLFTSLSLGIAYCLQASLWWLERIRLTVKSGARYTARRSVPSIQTRNGCASSAINSMALGIEISTKRLAS